jgi:type IV pilus assembly protein PilB
MRKLCVHCKGIDPISVQQQINLGLPPEHAGKHQIFKEEGCERCNFTGFSGRTAIYEVLTMTEAIKKAVAEEMSALQIKKIAIADGMQTLRMSAWKRVIAGISSISELLSNSAPDKDMNSSVKKVS